jgi:heme/copper-type cytochrome/quinol oxidase subunit 3
MGQRGMVWFATGKACAFAAFFGFMALYFAPKPGDSPVPLSLTFMLIPIVLTLSTIITLGGAVANALKQQAQRIERLERLLAERSPGFIAENPVSR